MLLKDLTAEDGEIKAQCQLSVMNMGEGKYRSNPDRPVFRSLVYCKRRALDHVVIEVELSVSTKEAMGLLYCQTSVIRPQSFPIQKNRTN
ncbi:unnamed protein product, partial [Timema podura]|nr:unnamed protein product [Timema podura]